MGSQVGAFPGRLADQPSDRTWSAAVTMPVVTRSATASASCRTPDRRTRRTVLSASLATVDTGAARPLRQARTVVGPASTDGGSRARGHRAGRAVMVGAAGG